MIKKTKNNKGFTLIELLVVISIISLLSSVVLASLNSARQKAEDVAIVQSVKSLTIALALTYDGGNYPTFGGALQCLSTTCTVGGTTFARNATLEAALLAQLPGLESEEKDRAFALKSLLAKTAHAQSIDLDGLPDTPIFTGPGGPIQGILYLGTGDNAHIFFPVRGDCISGSLAAPGTDSNICGQPITGVLEALPSGISSS